ncbi:hypothetical protein A2U01_0099439, partial [Trifolium medium]|nr:hypothetical protein [Trifolium medium]
RSAYEVYRFLPLLDFPNKDGADGLRGDD